MKVKQVCKTIHLNIAKFSLMDEKEYLSQDNFQNFDESKDMQEDELIKQDEIINEPDLPQDEELYEPDNIEVDVDEEEMINNEEEDIVIDIDEDDNDEEVEDENEEDAINNEEVDNLDDFDFDFDFMDEQEDEETKEENDVEVLDLSDLYMEDETSNNTEETDLDDLDDLADFNFDDKFDFESESETLESEEEQAETEDDTQIEIDNSNDDSLMIAGTFTPSDQFINIYATNDSIFISSLFISPVIKVDLNEKTLEVTSVVPIHANKCEYTIYKKNDNEYAVYIPSVNLTVIIDREGNVNVVDYAPEGDVASQSDFNDLLVEILQNSTREE
jgi:hypothetical protein